MSSSLNTRKLDPVEYDQWDAFVDQTPQGTVFNKSFWLQAHADVLGANVAIYGTYRGDNLVAGCALYVKELIGLKILTAPPCTPYMGILIQPRQTSDPARRSRHVVDVTGSLAATLESDFDRVLLINHPEVVDLRPFLWRRWSVQVYYTFIADLNTINEPSSRVRSALRKAAKLGIEVQPSDDIHAFHDLWTKTFARQGSVPRFSAEALAAIFGRLRAQDCCRLYLAFNRDDQPISGRIIVWSDRKASAWLLGTDPAFRQTGVTSQIAWHTMQDLKDDFDIFDMFGANTKSIASFKSQFGGRLTPYYQVSVYRSPIVKYADAIQRALGPLRTLIVPSQRAGLIKGG